MNELAVALGPGHHLIGVVTPPAGPPQRVAVLILNAGILPRTGPHRMGVKLARTLAACGHVAVRFDFSGLGDSRPPDTALPYREQALADVRAVMDHVEREHGIRAFALFGICAGADQAYAAALADARVAGIFMIDGYVYPTLRARAIQGAARLRRLTFGKILHSAAALVRGERPAQAVLLEEPARAPALPRPPRARFAAEMQSLADRGVRVALVYTVNSACRYQAQMRDAFARHPFARDIVCRREAQIDHTVTLLCAQRRLLALVQAWIADVEALPHEAAKSRA